VERISSGSSYVGSVADEQVKTVVRSSLLEATADFKRLSEPDAILICVPTPLGAKRLPDLRYVEERRRARFATHFAKASSWCSSRRRIPAPLGR
jgi:UDP-N-acetyl-D-glucosamine dehydrogenase